MNTENFYFSKQQFRKYLERSGIIDSLIKVLTGIYEEPEKPLNAMEFIKDNLTDTCPNSAEFEELTIILKELEVKCQEMESKNKDLLVKIADCKRSQEASSIHEKNLSFS